MRISRDELSLLDRGGRPTLADMLDKMTFSPTRGSIELNGARMVLSRATFGADLQDELIRRFGEREAMVLLLRLGYRSGREDAEFVRRAWPNLDIGDAFTAGTRLHMVTGTVRVETLHNDFDFRNDRFSGDFLWHDSVEATEYSRRHGRATKPVCWAQTGYAAGYASVFFRKLILYKEVSCAAMGDKSCRVVGKTVDDWGRDDPFVRMFLEEVLVTRAESLPRIEADDAPGPAARAEDLIVAPLRPTLERIAEQGLNALITGPDGSGRFAVANWLTAKRFRTAEVHRVHGASSTLPRVLEAITQALAKGTAGGQVLIIDALETLPEPVQVDLLALLKTARARPEKVLLVGLSTLPLSRLQGQGGLRAELLFALSVAHVALRPLANRPEDVVPLADAFLARTAQRRSAAAPVIEEEARATLKARPWPGNLPQLESTVLRAAMLAQTPGRITAADLRAATDDAAPSVTEQAGAAGEQGAARVAPLWEELRPLLQDGLTLDQVVSALERHALEEAGGNTSAAARLLGLTRAKLDYRLNRKGAVD
ncbi:XylR N-terminal domain-containing protein [Pseudooceanicola marinus]|uniref:XylR N-terminal domain-containing protein n=1 Tax=Pseudooceanicola marinus TaxID=396013 RepID=UPI001CD57126|nr:XylR N-terminal domain-containing protein [Pseudooceanicola marinus]MCA1334526.1 XylR N-terminal domain-containing protein [Pseudooceanicola marinus]